MRLGDYADLVNRSSYEVEISIIHIFYTNGLRNTQHWGILLPVFDFFCDWNILKYLLSFCHMHDHRTDQF
jgi:hypothetical protein